MVTHVIDRFGDVLLHRVRATNGFHDDSGGERRGEARSFSHPTAKLDSFGWWAFGVRSAAEEAAAALAAVENEAGRTTDPVRMYMREMGTVELLTREGEIVIAKRIEEGLRDVMAALAYYPDSVITIIDVYKRIFTEEGRLSDLFSGYIDPDGEPNPSPINPTTVVKSDDDDEEEEEEEKPVAKKRAVGRRAAPRKAPKRRAVGRKKSDD